MTSVRGTAVSVLALLPAILYFVTLFRLAKYRRDGGGFLTSFMSTGFRQTRPDIYTDQGQYLIRWLWAFAITSLPWMIVVVLLLG
jgi:hypothetical protein